MHAYRIKSHAILSKLIEALVKYFRPHLIMVQFKTNEHSLPYACIHNSYDCEREWSAI